MKIIIRIAMFPIFFLLFVAIAIKALLSMSADYLEFGVEVVRKDKDFNEATIKSLIDKLQAIESPPTVKYFTAVDPFEDRQKKFEDDLQKMTDMIFPDTRKHWPEDLEFNAGIIQAMRDQDMDGIALDKLKAMGYGTYVEQPKMSGWPPFEQPGLENYQVEKYREEEASDN